MSEKQTVPFVKIWLYLSNEPIIHENAQTYQKGMMFCVFEVEKGIVCKYPIEHIFRVVESYPVKDQEHK